MKKCPTCNAEYGDGATYCESCGTKLVKYRKCPHCGANVEIDATYCSRCGKAVDAVERVASVITPSSPTSNKKVTSSTIEQYKKEIAEYRSKRITLVTIGSILLAVGLVLTIVFFYLGVRATPTSGDPFTNTSIMYFLFGVLFELVTDAGIALLIVSAAVFGKKIANRQRIIDEWNSRY